MESRARNAKEAPESTTTSPPFSVRPQRPRANEKLVQRPSSSNPTMFALKSKPIDPSPLLPPKFMRSKSVYSPPPSRAAFTQFPAVDYKLVSVNQKPQFKYIIDKITQIPGELLAKIVAKERAIKSHFAPQPEKVVLYRYGPPPKPFKFFAKPSSQYLPANHETTTPTPSTTTTTESPVTVEATNDLDVNFMLPNGENVILLQPSARAVSGKDGTSIANPISRVILRKNRPQPTTILYRPQAVAISGPGGTSHAQAELIIDYVDE